MLWEKPPPTKMGEKKLEDPKVLFHCKYRKYVKRVLCQIGKNSSLTTYFPRLQRNRNSHILLMGMANANSYE